jgi:hypothetical protein
MRKAVASVEMAVPPAMVAGELSVSVSLYAFLLRIHTYIH